MKLIKNTFQLFGKIILPVYLLNMLFCLPLVALSFYTTPQQQLSLFPFYNFFTLILLEIFAILAVTSLYKSQTYNFKDHLQNAASKYGRIFLFLLLFAIVFSLGVMLLIIPAFVLSLMAFFMFPILVLEKLTLKEAWKKSRSLTKGYRWRLLGYGVLIAVFFIIFFSGVGSLSFFDGSIINQLPLAAQVLFRTILYPIDCLASIWIITFTTVAYLKRLEKPLPAEYSANEEKVELC